MMRRFSLSQRLTLLFTVLLLLCATVACAVQLYSSMQYGNAMVQRLSGGLAQQIVQREAIVDAQGRVDRSALKPLFDRLMTFNPSVELYVVSPDGDILADAAAFFGQRRTEQSDVMRFVDHGIKEGTERITVVCFPVGGKFLRRKIVCQIFKRLEFAFYGCQHSHPSYSSNTRACGTQRAIRQLKRLRRFN